MEEAVEEGRTLAVLLGIDVDSSAAADSEAVGEGASVVVEEL